MLEWLTEQPGRRQQWRRLSEELLQHRENLESYIREQVLPEEVVTGSKEFVFACADESGLYRTPATSQLPYGPLHQVTIAVVNEGERIIDVAPDAEVRPHGVLPIPVVMPNPAKNLVAELIAGPFTKRYRLLGNGASASPP